MHIRPNSRAVSPVVGAILMLALVIILAAVIGTFLLLASSDLTAGARAGVNVETETGGGTGTTTVNVITISNADVIKVTATVVDGSGRLKGGASEQRRELSVVGESATFEGNSSEGFEVQITAVAETDQDEAVILNRVVTL